MSTPNPASAARSFAPRDPETFFKAQKRNRRATWRMSALCVFAALVMGLPLTLVLTPFLYAITLIVADTVNYFSPLPPEFWQYANNLAHLGLRAADFVINQRGTIDPQDLAIGLALMLLPGMALALVLWLGMLLLFRHGGVGGTLASMNAREPDQADLKELQLADVVQEMAIAAGLPAPKVMLIDSPGANGAAIGTSPADARIVVSRRLLDDLNRDQLQALLAHLVASAGNGDLRIAFTVTSVFEASGLILTIINAPFGKSSRRALWRVIRYAFRGGPSTAKSADAGEVAETLSETLDMNSSDIDLFFNQQNPGIIKKFLRLLLFPFLFTNLAVEITLWFFLNVMLGPCMALLWRTRCYLADAGSVELTRNPDALASALQRLSEDNTAVDGGEWASHLFVVNPRGDTSLRGAGPTDEQKRKALEAWRATEEPGGTPSSTGAAGADEYMRVRKEMMSTGFAAATGNPQALARMQAFAKAMGGDPELGLHDMPSPNDIALARQGDRAAMARIRTLRQGRAGQDRPSRGQTGLQTHSFLSFHPPLNKRAKRLEKMGSHLIAPKRGYGLGIKIFTTVLWLIIGPLLAVAGALMLVVIAMMIGLNLIVLTLWLSVIHWAFGQDWVANYNGFMNFVNDVITAINRARR
ncbi:MAG TPA: M48 family metalloprotease [Candidatus Limnocylindrales bacterium]|nr:M48 family metalloprotease [Candidatus Limnocylindrales bacterium]